MSLSPLDKRWFWLCRFFAFTCALIICFIILFLFVESIPAIQSIGLERFFNDSSWHPTPDPSTGSFNLSAMLVGTLAATLGAIIFAGPLGILAAIFCHFYAPKQIAYLFRRMIELLAGIPSVVFGFWGLVTLAPIIRNLAPPGPSLCAGIIILTMMILPTVVLLSDAAIKNIPKKYIEGAAALGLSRWSTIKSIVIRASKEGLSNAIMLATGRAIGETMAVVMVCGNIAQIPNSLFDPIRTLTANIALELGYATGQHRSSLFFSGLLLLGIITMMVLISEKLKSEAIRD